MGNYTMPLRGHGIITAKRLLYRAMPNGSPLARQPPFDGQLYHVREAAWYNNHKMIWGRLQSVPLKIGLIVKAGIRRI